MHKDSHLSDHSIRSFAASLLACTLYELFPGAKIAKTAVNGICFYCDVQLPTRIEEGFLPHIDEKMRLVAFEARPVKFLHMMRENAAELFFHKEQSLKAELSLEQTDNIIDVIQIGEFYDLSIESLVTQTSDLKAFKLTSLSDVEVQIGSENCTLQRIEGLACTDKQQLKVLMKQFQQAKKIDPINIGIQAGLFVFDLKEGFYWTHKGEAVRQSLDSAWRRFCIQDGFQIVETPQFYPLDACEGFLQREVDQGWASQFILFKKEYIFPVPEAIRHARLIDKKQFIGSQLPIKFAEIQSGAFPKPILESCGLFHPQMGSSDRCHIVCAPSQGIEQIRSSLEWMKKWAAMFEVEFELWISNSPRYFSGSSKIWKQSVDLLIQGAQASGCILRELQEGRMDWRYGPSIEFRWGDLLGRCWSGPFFGIDCFHPDKFKWQMIDDDKKTPLLFAFSLFGTIESLMGHLLEKGSGVLPFWLAPEQIRILVLSQYPQVKAKELFTELQTQGYKVTLENAGENLSSKMYQVQVAKVPYVIVLGKDEARSQKISLRKINEQDTTQLDKEELLSLFRQSSLVSKRESW